MLVSHADRSQGLLVDNINNSYDSQGAVQVVIDTTGDCDSLRGTMLPFTINYGVSASVLRPVLQVDNAAHQVRTSLDFTDPTLVAFPREYNSVRAETTVGGTRVSTVFNRDITPPSITAATFGSVSSIANNYGFRITSSSAGLIGIDARNDSGMSIFNHGSMAACSFTPEGTGCDEVAPDGSGRSQRCFMPNMLTGQRTGTCDISEGRVINYLSPGVNSLNMLNRADYQQVIARIPVRSYVTFVVYVTDQALNVSTASYRVAVAE
ncbi:hypothetical protein KBB08_03605 [Candidatus Gracilibacteria bacterium]|nr:hypothetical protein [Candidatus Gracilibacteria bacterium]